MIKAITIAFRVDAEMKQAIEKAAENDERTLSALIVRILREWLRENGYLK